MTSMERHSRGEGERILLINPDMKAPYDINKFLSVGKNKEELFELIQRSIVEMNTGGALTIFFCLRDCFQIQHYDERPRPDLYSDHEEADIKLVAYAKLVDNGPIMVRSPSGDIDIIVLFAYHFMSSDVQIYINNGTGTKRKVVDVSSCSLPMNQRRAIVGLHAFSGNDYLSSFFWKA